MEAAFVQYEKAWKKEPSNPVALTKSARALISLGKTEEAMKELEKCVSENPNYVPAFLLLGEKLNQINSTKKALWCYEEANAINPFNPDVHKNLSTLYERTGEHTKAQQESEVLKFLIPSPSQREDKGEGSMK